MKYSTLIFQEERIEVIDAVEVVKNGTSTLLVAFNRDSDTFSSVRLIDFAAATVVREVQLPFVASRVFPLTTFGSWTGEELDPRFLAPVALCDPNEIPFVLDLFFPGESPYLVASVQEFELRIHDFPCAAFWSSLGSPIHPMLPLAPFQFRDGEKTLIFSEGIRPNVQQDVPDRNTYNRLPITFLGEVSGLRCLAIGFKNGCFELLSLEADAEPNNVKILYSGRASGEKAIRSIIYLEQPADFGFLCVLSDQLEVYQLTFTASSPFYVGLREISGPKVIDIPDICLLDRLPLQKGDDLVIASESDEGCYVFVYSALEDSVIAQHYLAEVQAPLSLRVDPVGSSTQTLKISLLSATAWDSFSLPLAVEARGRAEQVESLGLAAFSLSAEQLEALTGSPLPSLFDFCLDHGLCHLLCQYIGSLGFELNTLEVPTSRPQRLQDLRQRAKDRFSRLETGFVPLPMARSAFAVLLDLKLVYQELLYITDPRLMSAETRELLHKDLDQIILLAQFYELQIWLLEQHLDRAKRNPCVETRRRRLELQHSAGLGPQLFLDHLLERLSGQAELPLDQAFRPLAGAPPPADNFAALFEKEHTLGELVRLYQSGDPLAFREKRLLFLYVLLELERTTGEIGTNVVDSFISTFMVSEQDRNMTEAFWLLDKALDDHAIDEQITFDALARLDGTTDDWVNPILQTLVARDQPDKNARYIFWTLLRNNLTFEALYYQRLVDIDTRRGLLRELFEQLPTAALLQLPLSSEEQCAQTDPAALERLVLFALQRCRPGEARLLLQEHPETLAGLRELVDKFDQLAPSIPPPSSAQSSRKLALLTSSGTRQADSSLPPSPRRDVLSPSSKGKTLTPVKHKPTPRDFQASSKPPTFGAFDFELPTEAGPNDVRVGSFPLTKVRTADRLSRLGIKDKVREAATPLPLKPYLRRPSTAQDFGLTTPVSKRSRALPQTATADRTHRMQLRSRR